MDRRWTARSCAANCIWPYYSLSKLGLEGGPRVWEAPPFFNKVATRSPLRSHKPPPVAHLLL